MSSGANVRAGRAFVELFADKSKLVKGLKSAEKDLKAFGAGVTRIGGTIAAAGAAIVAPIVGAAAKFASFGDNLNKMAARTGVSVEALSQLKFAAEQSGASIEDLGAVLQKMNRRVGRVTAGAGSSVETAALEELGLSMEKLQGMNAEERFLAIADAMANYGDNAAAAGLAQRAFGTGVDKLLPLIFSGREGIKQLREEAQRLGVTMSTEDADAAAEYTDAMNRLKRSLEAAWQTVGAAVAPVLTELSNRLAAAAGKVREFIAEHREVIVTALKVGAVIAAAGTAIAGIGAPFVTAGFVIGTVTTAVTTLSTAFAFLAANPLVIVFTGIVAAAGLATAAIMRSAVHVDKISDSISRWRQKQDELRASTMNQFATLTDLADKERLTNEEMDKAEGIISRLEMAYGDLGITLDRTQGKLSGVAEAQAAANKQMRAAALHELKAELKELERTMASVNQEAAGGNLGAAFGGFLEGGFKGMDEAEADWQREKMQENIALSEKYQAILARIRALEGGDVDALSGGASPADAALPDLAPRNEEATQLTKLHDQRMDQIAEEEAAELTRIREKYALEKQLRERVGADVAPIERAQAEEEAAARETFTGRRGAETEDYGSKLDQLAGGPEDALAQARARADFEAGLAERLADLKIRLIDNEEEREIASIKRRYAADREQAEKIGADLAALNQAEKLEIGGVKDRHEEERTTERETARERITDEIERNTILRDKEGLDQQMALIKLDEKKALREAGETGVPIDKIVQQFALRRQLAAKDFAAQNQQAERTASPTGTFSAAALAVMGGPKDAEERTAKNTEKTVGKLGQLLGKTDDVINGLGNVKPKFA